MKKACTFIFALIVAGGLFACGGKTPLADDQKPFAGTWVADDGTFVTIYLDGGGDMKGSNTSVTGGSATFTADTLTIGMGPIKKTMTITRRPMETEGRVTIVLDGITYSKK